MDANEIQLGDTVIIRERDRFAHHECVVVAIQRRRFRAEIEWPDGHRTWHPVRVLELTHRPESAA